MNARADKVNILYAKGLNLVEEVCLYYFFEMFCFAERC